MLSRRLFLKLTLMWPFANLIAACGGDGTPISMGPISGGNCTSNGTTVSVGGNHGHTIPTVTAGQVSTGSQLQYTVGAGSAGHSHIVTVTSAHFASLQGNNGVSIATDSDGTGHSHTITINCV